MSPANKLLEELEKYFRVGNEKYIIVPLEYFREVLDSSIHLYHKQDNFALGDYDPSEIILIPTILLEL